MSESTCSDDIVCNICIKNLINCLIPNIVAWRESWCLGWILILINMNLGKKGF